MKGVNIMNFKDDNTANAVQKKKKFHFFEKKKGFSAWAVCLFYCISWVGQV